VNRDLTIQAIVDRSQERAPWWARRLLRGLALMPRNSVERIRKELAPPDRQAPGPAYGIPATAWMRSPSTLQRAADGAHRLCLQGRYSGFILGRPCTVNSEGRSAGVRCGNPPIRRFGPQGSHRSPRFPRRVMTWPSRSSTPRLRFFGFKGIRTLRNKLRKARDMRCQTDRQPPPAETRARDRIVSLINPSHRFRQSSIYSPIRSLGQVSTWI
jgi:hypothetical protein